MFVCTFELNRNVNTKIACEKLIVLKIYRIGPLNGMSFILKIQTVKSRTTPKISLRFKYERLRETRIPRIIMYEIAHGSGVVANTR